LTLHFYQFPNLFYLQIFLPTAPKSSPAAADREQSRADHRLLDRGWIGPTEAASIRTVARRPVPDPPQLRQGILRVPAQVRHPSPSPSDHREQRHSTLPVPLHVAHRGFGCGHRAAAAGLPSCRDLLAMATPASIPSPADATAIGATIFFLARVQDLPKNLEGSGEREVGNWCTKQAQ
jgi:hypothetical protein